MELKSMISEQTACICIWALLRRVCAVLGMLFNPSVPQFIIPDVGIINNNTHYGKLLSGLNDLLHMKHLEMGASIKSAWASQMALVLKNPPANAGDMRCGFDP